MTGARPGARRGSAVPDGVCTGDTRLPWKAAAPIDARSPGYVEPFPGISIRRAPSVASVELASPVVYSSSLNACYRCPRPLKRLPIGAPVPLPFAEQAYIRMQETQAQWIERELPLVHKLLVVSIFHRLEELSQIEVFKRVAVHLPKLPPGHFWVQHYWAPDIRDDGQSVGC